jgi:hypothetical protein
MEKNPADVASCFPRAAGVGFSPSAGNYPVPGAVSCHDRGLYKMDAPPVMSTHHFTTKSFPSKNHSHASLEDDTSPTYP